MLMAAVEVDKVTRLQALHELTNPFPIRNPAVSGTYPLLAGDNCDMFATV